MKNIFRYLIIFTAALLPAFGSAQSPAGYPDAGRHYDPAGCEAAFTYEQDSADILIFNFFDHSTGSISDYHWDFGDGSTATGTIVSHSFPGIGTYKVCLTVSNTDTSNLCSDSVCAIIDLNPQQTYSLGGLLYAGNFPINNPFNTNDVGYAYLYQLAGGNIYPLDSVQFDTLGYFYFTNVPEGNYLLKAGLTSASNHFSTYMPGYYRGSRGWSNADTVRVTKDFFMAHVHMQPLTSVEQGSNSLIGYVITDDQYAAMARTTACEVILSDSAGRPVRIAYTDDDGSFHFDGLPVGHYSLQAEQTGLYSDIVDVVADEFNQVSDSVEIRLHYSPQGIGTGGSHAAFDVSLYPNPVSGVLNLNVKSDREMDARYELISNMGHPLLRDNLQLTRGTTHAKIDVTRCPAGLYVLTVSDDRSGARISVKVVVR